MCRDLSRKHGDRQPLLTLVTIALFAHLAWQSAFCENANKNTFLRYEEPRLLTGRIYAKGSDRRNVLFKFSRQATRSGDNLQVLREYTHPDGRVAARERIYYAGDHLVSYELEELQIGARGRAEIRRDPRPSTGRIWFEYSDEPLTLAKPKTDSEQLHGEVLVNDMIGPFLVSHWEELISGKNVKCRYIVVPRRETVGFTFRKQSEEMHEGRSVVILKMEATSPLIAVLVEPLFFTIEKNAPHHVLEYDGRTTPKIKSGSKWKDLDAVTVFDWP